LKKRIGGASWKRKREKSGEGKEDSVTRVTVSLVRHCGPPVLIEARGQKKKLNEENKRNWRKKGGLIVFALIGCKCSAIHLRD